MKKGGVTIPRLENWSIIGDFDPYKAPELQYKMLQGEIYDDEKKRFNDGRYVRTSQLIELNIKNNYAQTKNTKYILGKVSEDYLKWLKENDMTLEQFQN